MSEDQRQAERAARCLGGRYEVMRPLGRGGMGQVWLAWDRVVDREVALKILDPELAASVENRERFRREALIAARFPHPHIVPCFEFRCDRESAVAVMRLTSSIFPEPSAGPASTWNSVRAIVPMIDRPGPPRGRLGSFRNSRRKAVIFSSFVSTSNSGVGFVGA